MTSPNYTNNPLVHRDRRLGNSQSAWIASFDCSDVRPLIICRGPIRKEAMDVFTEMGIVDFGILLSEKDSITYPNALSPELRMMKDSSHVHRVPDYTGATKGERQERIRQIIKIARDNNYNAIYAGYGFMSEDAEMVESMENAGLHFIGPCSFTQRAAGMKDEAKRTALASGVSVTPGVNNATSLAVVAKYGADGLEKCARENKLDVDFSSCANEEEKVLALLTASYDAGIDIIDAADIGEALKAEAKKMLTEKPDNRFRLKAIAGGGGKGQRILQAANSYPGDTLEDRVEKAAAVVPGLALECLIELKTNGVGDNKNVLLEMNIDTTRHQEIQVLGNGEWCMTMGGRDCSLQMHEQKLLEVSVTVEELELAITTAEKAGRLGEAEQLRKDLIILQRMEDEGARFGEAVKLDSLGTFECIVDGESHYFMEMNTRIQVEHRVTELCYDLVFTNPDNANESFVVDSLVEVMVLLEHHGKRLPKPSRRVRKSASVEARLNATNDALQPHAGGLISWWSEPSADEVRDDQGISLHNPDTDVFMKYKLAGAYDSNIALILTHGSDRQDTYERLAEIIRGTTLLGEDLCTNLDFHYGLVNWFLGSGIQARPTTKFIMPYLTAVGLLKQAVNNLDLNYAFNKVLSNASGAAGGENASAVSKVIERKRSLLIRPVEKLFRRPHALAGWLAVHRDAFEISGDNAIGWKSNPVDLLLDLYHYLNMDADGKRHALNTIWDHDHAILSTAQDFYAELNQRISADSFAELSAIIEGRAPGGFDATQWEAVQSSHAGFQLGMDFLKLLAFVAAQTDFFALSVNDDLSINIPARLLDGSVQKAMAKVLVPPPPMRSDEIAAASGGMFYAREAPGMDAYVNRGDHFEAGDVLYIVEVMKMFNKVVAPFSGTVTEVLVEGDGVIIAKGQPLFRIKPDEEIVVESEAEIAGRKRSNTDEFIAVNLG